MTWGEFRVSLTVLNVDCVGPGFHVKHVNTDLSVIAEVHGHRRMLDELRRNGCGCMTRQNVGCRDNRAAGWNVAWNHREARTRPDQCLPPLAERVDLGRGSEPAFTLRLAPLRWSLGVGKGRCGRPQVRTLGPATMNPRGRSSPQHDVRSVDRHGSVVKVRRERRWNTTSVSRETTGRFGIAARKRGLMPLHERRCVLRCLCRLTPETMNNHPTPLLEQSLGSEETRYRQVLVLPRFHVKHGKWRFHPYRICVARPYRGVAVLVDVVLRRR